MKKHAGKLLLLLLAALLVFALAACNDNPGNTGNNGGTPGGDTWQDITVVLNARARSTAVDLPEGTWQVVARDGRIDARKGLGAMPGGQVIVGPRSALILHR